VADASDIGFDTDVDDVEWSVDSDADTVGNMDDDGMDSSFVVVEGGTSGDHVGLEYRCGLATSLEKADGSLQACCGGCWASLLSNSDPRVCARVCASAEDDAVDEDDEEEEDPDEDLLDG